MPVPGESGHIEAHNKWNQFVQDARAGKVSELVGPRGPQGPKGEPGERGLQGPVGPQGKQGQGIDFKGSYDTYAEFIKAHPIGEPGDIYLVAESLYVWNSTTNSWEDEGSLRGPAGPTGPQGPAGKDGVASATYPVEYDENTRDVSLNPLLGMVQVQPIDGGTGPGLTVGSGDVDSVVNEDLGVVHDAARIAFEHHSSGYDGWVTKYTNRLAINSSDRISLGVGDDVATALEVDGSNNVNTRNDLSVQGDAAVSGSATVTGALSVQGENVLSKINTAQSGVNTNASDISSLQTTVAEKADKTWVQSELDLKADTATVNSELAAKASTQDLDNQIGTVTAELSDKADLVGGSSAPSNTKGMRNITVSSSAPSGGSDGDVWLRY